MKRLRILELIILLFGISIIVIGALCLYTTVSDIVKLFWGMKL